MVLKTIMNNSRIFLYTVLVSSLIANFIINGFPEKLGFYKTTGLIILILVLVYLIISKFIKKKK